VADHASSSRRSGASGMSRMGYVFKSALDEVKADPDAKKVAVKSSVKNTPRATSLTLDDFGGRSDALGG
jgi:hypothetical protein